MLVDDVVVNIFPLDKSTITIGRALDNDIVIDEEAVSSQHARIELIPNEFMDGLIDIFIEDQDSTNGTFVNDEAVKRRQLHNLDHVRIAWTDLKLVSNKDVRLAKTSVIPR